MAQRKLNLKVTKKTRDDGKIQLTITVPSSFYDSVRRGATMTLAQQSNIDIGMAAKDGDEAVHELILEKVGEPQYLAFINHYTMTSLTPFVITEENLEIIMEPEVSSSDQFTEGKDFRYIAVVTPKPVYELTSYDPVTIQVPDPNVSEAEVERMIVLLAEDNVREIEDKGAAIKEDSDVAFSIKTVGPDGSEVENLSATRRVYKLGEDFLPAEFDQNLIGMKAGETKTFPFDIPDPVPGAPEGAEIPMVTVTTTVTIQQVIKKVIPAITDGWVAANMPKQKNLEGLREMYRQQGYEYKKHEVDEMKFNLVTAELAMRFEGSITDEIYEYTSQELMGTIQYQLQQQGKTMDQYIEEQGMDQQQFSMQLMLQTRDSLRQGFSLDALARHLKLTINEEDITYALMRIAAPGKQKEARKQFDNAGRGYQLTEAALRMKANKWLLDTATFEYVDMSALEGEMQAKGEADACTSADTNADN